MKTGHLVRPDGTINTGKNKKQEPEGTEGQDRDNYTDDQDRESYTVSNEEKTPQHTPAPWEISKIGNNYDQYSIYAGDSLVANSVEGETNARLIAAAPELLEALKDFIRAWQDDKVTSAISNQVYAAIAKAEGGDGE